MRTIRSQPPPVQINKMSDLRELEEIIKTREVIPPNFIQRGYRAILALTMTFAEYVDLSKYQSPSKIDYPSVKAGGKSVIWLRTSDGKNSDSEFPTHWQKCLDAGISVAVYHFFRSNLTGEEQAALIWTLIQPLIEALGYMPFIWLDVESTDLIGNNTRILRLKACIDTLNSYIWGHSGQKERVGIYSSPGFANVSLIPVPAWLKVTTPGARIFQWLAHYVDSALPTQPNGWPVANRIGWQKGIAGTHEWIPYPVDGFGWMKIDYDYAFMGQAEFIAFNGVVTTPPPVEPPPANGDVMKQAKGLLTLLQIRNKPAKTIDVGDILKNEIVSYYPNDTVTLPSQEWLHVRKSDNTVGWAARIHPEFTGISLELLP